MASEFFQIERRRATVERDHPRALAQDFGGLHAAL